MRVPRVENFRFFRVVQTDSGVQPSFFPMGTGGPFPGSERRQERAADNSPQLSAEEKRRTYTFASPVRSSWRRAWLS
jgi:hypothetical protein